MQPATERSDYGNPAAEIVIGAIGIMPVQQGFDSGDGAEPGAPQHIFLPTITASFVRELGQTD
jgi:hypothetical protein